MKSVMNKLDNIYIGKGIYYLMILSTVFFVLFLNLSLDNDIWFLLNHGKYVLLHGIPKVEPFTIHSNLNFVMQQWLSSVIFYLVYSNFGIKSLFFLVFILNSIMVIIFYKLCMLVSCDNYKVSSLITLVFDVLMCLMFVVCRPQMFTYIFVLLLIYCMEAYVRKNNNRYLYFLPIISLLQINFHASMWFLLYVFMIPYFFDGFNKRTKNNYKKLPILITMIVMFLFALLNPYGIDSLMYLFKSYGVDSINNYIGEMKALNVNENNGKIIFVFSLLIFMLNIYIGKNKIKIRYFLLFIGTYYLTLSSYKGFSYLLLASLFSVCCYMRSFFFINKSREIYSLKYKLIYSCIGMVIIGFFIYEVNINKFEYSNKLESGINLLLKKYDKKKIKLYVGYDDGGYTEFRGIKSYIDPRAEVFLKSNNGRFDIFDEYLSVYSGDMSPGGLISKYNFTHILVVDSEKFFYKYMSSSKKYSLFYSGDTDSGNKYKIYVRNDLIS